MASYEDATRCPQCGQPGNVRKKLKPQAGGTTLHVVYCENERCEWFDTAWNVSVRPDGTVPDPQDFKGKPKTYAKGPSDAQLEAQIAYLMRQLQDGNEIKNPNAPR